jgi:hypothetical protein
MGVPLRRYSIEPSGAEGGEDANVMAAWAASRVSSRFLGSAAPGCARAAAGAGLRRDRRVIAHLTKTALFYSYTIIMLYCYDAIIGLSREELTSGQDRTG